MALPEFIHSFTEFFQRLFILDPNEPFKTGAKVVAIGGTLFTILTTLVTKTLPWLRTKLESRSASKRVGAELYSKQHVEKAIRYYIPPFCQALDPAGAEEPRLVSNPKQKLFDYLDEALEHPTEYNYIFLLADSGMGKTSALLNYYVRHVRRWRKPYNLVLIPLGIPDADNRIAAVENKRETVLFLDALDEDTLAIVDHVERLRLLLKATYDFQRVVISCRTQFFSKDEEIPKETGKIKVGARAAGEPAEYLFHKIYLSPFSDKQIETYLRRRYPIWQLRSRALAREMAQKIPHLTARPMLLAHIDDLVHAKRQVRYSHELYEEMIEAWLEREKGFISNKDDLRRFSERLAVDLYINRKNRGAERIPKSALAKLAKEWNIPLDEWKLSGRSLLNRDAEKGFKFAHRSIMEYLFVKRFIDGDAACLEVIWTDQMETFLWEMLLRNAESNNKIDDSIAEFYKLWHGKKGRQLLVSMLTRNLHVLRVNAIFTNNNAITSVLVQLCALMLWLNQQGDIRVTLYTIIKRKTTSYYLVCSRWNKATPVTPTPSWLQEFPSREELVVVGSSIVGQPIKQINRDGAVMIMPLNQEEDSNVDFTRMRVISTPKKGGKISMDVRKIISIPILDRTMNKHGRTILSIPIHVGSDTSSYLLVAQSTHPEEIDRLALMFLKYNWAP